MFKIIALVLAAAVAIFFVYVALRPSDFRITRSQSIEAAPETIFALVNNLHGFNRWNPFAQGDPTLKLVYSGPEAGRGAAYAWDSSGKTGQGRTVITESLAASRVVMKLEFLKPLTATNSAEFTLAPSGSSTTVTWSMSGKRPFSHKLLSTIFNFDKIVGGEFEEGLARLKVLIERPGATAAK